MGEAKIRWWKPEFEPTLNFMGPRAGLDVKNLHGFGFGFIKTHPNPTH
jgi:hypothetical protein